MLVSAAGVSKQLSAAAARRSLLCRWYSCSSKSISLEMRLAVTCRSSEGTLAPVIGFRVSQQQHAAEAQTGLPCRLRAVGHSLGGASLLIYLVMCRRACRAHRLYRLILLTPAGFLESAPLVSVQLLSTPLLLQACAAKGQESSWRRQQWVSLSLPAVAAALVGSRCSHLKNTRLLRQSCGTPGCAQRLQAFMLL